MFYKVPEAEDQNTNAAFQSSEDFFDFEKYLAWQEEKSIRNKDNNIDFIRALTSTQSFHKFIE